MTTATETDCRTETGITVGLLDSIISICRVLHARDLSPAEVQEALADLRQDQDVTKVMGIAQ